MVRSGEGSEMSGERHHSSAAERLFASGAFMDVDSGVDAENWCMSEGLDAENATPENAYLSQRIVVPEWRRLVIVDLINGSIGERPES
jgi:hypothetical protein